MPRRKTKTLAKRLKKVEKYISNEKRVTERKWYDGNQLVLQGTGSGDQVQLHLPDIAVGDDVNARIGSQITLKSISCKGYFQYGDATNKCRFMIYSYVPQPEALYPMPVIGDLLENGSQFYTSHYKKNSDWQFRILHDKRFVMNSQFQPTYLIPMEKGIKNFEWRKSFKNGVLIKYDNDQSKPNPINLSYAAVMIADSSIQDHPDAIFECRITWEDQ